MKSAIQGMLFIDASNLQITNVTETEVNQCNQFTSKVTSQSLSYILESNTNISCII